GYTVTEAAVTGFVTESTGDTGTIGTETSKADFTNTRETGGFSVSKSVESGTESDKNKEFHFTVTLDDDSINGTYGEMEFTDGVAEFTLKDGESRSAEGLPATVGYTVVEEEANSDSFVTTSTNAEGRIRKDSSPEAAFVNSKVESGSLKIKKNVLVNGETTTGDLADGTYTFHITGTKGQTVNDVQITITNGASNEARVDNLIPDDYTVTEDTENNPEGMTVSGSAEQTVTVTANNTASIPTAEFTNNRELAELEVRKKVISNVGSDKDRTFAFTVTLSDTTINGTYGSMHFTDGIASFSLKDGESAVAVGLPKGIAYTVSEEENADFETGKTGDTGTISEKPSVAEFTNSRIYTKATVKKVWDDEENREKLRPENLTVTLSNGMKVTLNEGNKWEATVENLPKYENGEEITYTWEEGELPEGYTLAGTSTKGTITTITNKKSGENAKLRLIINKKVLKGSGAPLKTKQVFYAGIFSDEACTIPSEAVKSWIVKLDPAGGSEASRTVEVTASEKGTCHLYVTEVDQDGKKLGSGFAYKYTVKNGHVTLTPDTPSQTVTITNTRIEKTPTRKKTPTQNRGADTGDDTPIALYASLLAASLAVILLLLLRKK
ncbi:MAG: Cna B-type domain-containing protein, partial [Eubacteriales bacterium]|nr:Cna B-type domain-containing protein [Eubacteriales bacterium]